MTEVEISFVLPTFNEAGNIGRLIEGIDRCVEGMEKEFIVVDDNSTDGTWQLVERLSREDPRVRLILRTADRGLTPSLQEGIEAARGGLVSWMDCDLSMPPEKLPEMIRQIHNGFDCVVGSRFVAGGGVEFVTGGPDSLTGIVLSVLLNRFTARVLGGHVRDYTSGFVVVRKQVLGGYRLKGDYGEYFIRLMHRLHKSGCTIMEIPYMCRAREAGTSKTGSNLWTYLKRGWRYIAAVIELKLRPPGQIDG